jgi:hypothetical protein
MSTMFATQGRASPIKGLILDRPPWAVDRNSLVVARNIRVKDGAILTIGGKSLIGTAADAGQVSFIGLPTFFGSTQTGIVGTNLHLHQMTGQGLQALNALPFAGNPGDLWEMAMMLGRAYFMSPSVNIERLDNNLLLKALVSSVGSIPLGFTMTDFYNHLIVANLLEPVVDQQSFIGSGRGDDSFWNLVDLTQEARSFLVPLNNEPIVCIRKLGDYLYIYKTFSIHQVTYNPGTATIYGVEAIRSRTGAKGSQTVVYVPGQLQNSDIHIFIGQDNIYRNDGSITAIGDRIWDDFAAKVRPDAWNKIIGWYHEITHEVYFGYISVDNPSATEPDSALVYDIKNDCYFYRDWPFTAGGYMLNNVLSDRWIDHPEDWNHILPAGRPWVSVTGLEQQSPFVGGAAGQVWQYEATPNSDFDSIAQTGILDFDDDAHVKTVSGMRLDVQGLTPTTPLEIWGRGLLEIDEYMTKPFQQVASMTGGSLVHFQLSGRWLDFQFIQRAGGVYRMGSWEPFFRTRGTR